MAITIVILMVINNVTIIYFNTLIVIDLKLNLDLKLFFIYI